MYHSKNLALIPDISVVGREYYTLVYQLYLPLQNKTSFHNSRRTMRIEGINYRASAYLNGKPIPDLADRANGGNTDPTTSMDGMFRRRYYEVSSGGRFLLIIEPPLHPGNFSNTVQGQGGNHQLAMDGPTAQFMLGWDWCQAMPDRSTGFFGSTALHHTSGRAAIIDPAIHTINITCNGNENGHSSPSRSSSNCNNNVNASCTCTSVWIAIMARIECINDVHYVDNQSRGPQFNSNYCRNHNATLTVTSDWGENWTLSSFSMSSKSRENTETTDLYVTVKVNHPERVHIWWPHGVGAEPVAHLHSFSFLLEIDSKKGRGFVSDRVFIDVGIRTIETYLDKKLQAQVFAVNGHQIYLVGGNWITSDQALRYSASEERYCKELALHVHAGLILIRVWGGGVAERDAFYNCADRHGLLVFQEFWMTGDNNGRWGGSYNWPLDYISYLGNVEDTVCRLRRHASLLFYGGCNECLAPRNESNFPNPPREIDDGIRNILNQFDPGRFYISSSMGGKNKADNFEDPNLWSNRSFSLAFADGPYGMLLPSTMFQRNPGLNDLVPDDVRVGFQPEIGSTSAPTYRGLLRFMSFHEASVGVPSRHATKAGEIWEYHKFEPWLTPVSNDSTYDHVYSYFTPGYKVNASEWCAAAQLAAHAQYQNLMNAFVSHAFEYTAAVILWKSQSPWPSLRGFLYDWYLEATGSLRGVRAALLCPVSVAFDPSSWKVRVINRSLWPLQQSTESSVGAKYAWVNLEGKVITTGEMFLAKEEIVLPMTTKPLNGKLQWPTNCSSVCFLRLMYIGPRNLIFSSWNWLTNPVLGDSSDFSALEGMRSRQAANAFLFLDDCAISNASITTVQVRIELSRESQELLFYPALTLSYEGQEILPVFDDGETETVLLPGRDQKRELYVLQPVSQGSQIKVTLSSWNGPTREASGLCFPISQRGEQWN